MSAAFQSNVAHFSAGPSHLDAACTSLVLITDLSAPLTTKMAALLVSTAACIIACVMLYLDAILPWILQTNLYKSMYIFCILVCLVPFTPDTLFFPLIEG